MSSLFCAAINRRFLHLSEHELFVVEHPDVFAEYLKAFPPGTNPIFRVRTEHDCSACRNFVRHLGLVVAVVGGEVCTVWDVDVEEPYATVADRMAALVRSLPVVGVLRSKEAAYGSSHDFDKKTNQRYDHLHGRLAARHRCTDPGTKKGEAESAVQVLRRGLEELTLPALDEVLDLVEQNQLYRGAEHLRAVRSFREAKVEYGKAERKDLFLWSRHAAPVARFRNTAIGTLVVDLSERTPTEDAVKKFEAMVAPQNYRRPTAAITPRMVEGALATLKDLGLEDAVERRHARMSDVSVNDVLFVDGSVRNRTKDGGLRGLLMEEARKPVVKVERASKVAADAFFAEVLPGARQVDVLVENRHQGNFVSVTAPARAQEARLFKWDNDFAWSYDGEVADSLRQKVVNLGGRVDGVLRFSHAWNYDRDRPNKSLMDLHVFCPGSGPHEDGCHDRYPGLPRVGWNWRSDWATMGVQDVDHVNPPADDFTAVENITFPKMERLPEGQYVFKIHNWNLRPPTLSGVKAEVEFGGRIFSYEIRRPMKHKEWVTLARATLRDGKFSIEHVAEEVGAVGRKKWGVQTESLVPADAILTSPNCWGGRAVGNRHLFFVLRGCRNPDPARGIYNEFLRPGLEPHRKVFEVLGGKTKVQPADEQLSGVGFSSGRGDSVSVVVDGKAYEVTF